jgi:hypothetical protein
LQKPATTHFGWGKNNMATTMSEFVKTIWKSVSFQSFLILLIAAISFLLSVDLSALSKSEEKSAGTNTDNSLNSNAQNNVESNMQTTSLASTTEAEFLQREYDTGTKEIETRIDQEHDLFLKKLIFVGVVLGSVFFSKKENGRIKITSLRVFCFWAAVAVAAVMDIRLMFNNIIILDHGKWIAIMENHYLSGNGFNAINNSATLPGWENFFKTNCIIFGHPQAAFTFTDRQLLTSILFILALYLSAYFMEDGKKRDVVLIKGFAIGSLFLIAWPGLLEKFQPWHLGLAIFGACLVPLLRFEHNGWHNG